MRRDSSDTQWREVKERVRKRDGNKDRLLRILTVKDALLLRKKAPVVLLRKLDAAHIFPVSTHPEIVYVDANIVTLNRYSHEALDNLRDPLTNEPISYEERQEWWRRIAGESQWKTLSSFVNTLGSDDSGV
jgi:hypothetical protein